MSTETGTSRWALSPNELIFYSVAMLIAIAAPFSGFVFEVGFGGEPIDLLRVAWLVAALIIGGVYLGRRRRRTAADDIVDEFFDR